eukprot:COSAG02_NODE_1644_length_11524_cov_76.342232_14_plen_108_part_00
MAAEGRHKSPSKLGSAGEERQKVPLGVVLIVHSIGSQSLTLPVTPWEYRRQRGFRLVTLEENECNPFRILLPLLHDGLKQLYHDYEAESFLLRAKPDGAQAPVVHHP